MLTGNEVVLPQFVTTIKAADPLLTERARAAAHELNLPFIERNSIALADEIAENEIALVFEKRGLALHSQQGIHRFHLNLAGLRIINIDRGLADNMSVAMALRPGKRVLDCTLGLASDAIVASYVVGASGRVHGCEQSTLLHYVTKNGLANYSTNKPALDSALRRVTSSRGSYHDFLESVATKSFDVIYFDPMFEQPQHKSSAFTPLRNIVCNLSLATATLELAIVKTAERVVIKLERHYHSQLVFDDIIGGKNAAIRYGVIYGR